MASTLQLVVNTFLKAFSTTLHFLTGYYFYQSPKQILISKNMKNIIILGGSMAGINTAHRILKQAAKGQTRAFKITLVSPNSHFFWNIAAPRAIIPGQITDDQIFEPIAAGFSHYPNGQFEFILGAATSLDVIAKKVEISRSGSDIQTLEYDYLILATGTSAKDSVPFSNLSSTEETKRALHDFQKRIKEAKTIVVAGGGPTGVETAGEIAFEYGQEKEVILLSSEPVILPSAPANVSKTAAKHVQSLNISLKLNTKALGSPVPQPDGRLELSLSDNSKIITDLYIPAFGSTPNTSYIPTEFLNKEGFVMVDPYLTVKNTKDVWAVGDVSDMEWPQAIFCERQSVHMANNLVLLLSDKVMVAYKFSTSRIMGLQIGRKKGVGHLGNWGLPGFLIAFLRKTLLIEKVKGIVNGSAA